MQTHSRILKRIVLFVSLSLLACPPDHAAALLLGGFESGDFTGWAAVGDATVVANTFGSGPSAGFFQALVSTVNFATDGFTSFSFVNNAIPGSDLETFLEVAPGSLSTLAGGNPFVEGSAIHRSFLANAGDTLTFDWNFLTDEPMPSLSNDLGFVRIDAEVILLADTFSAFAGGSSTPLLDETGYQSFTHVFTTTGVHTLGFGVVDVRDDIGASGLLVDQVVLTASPVTPIPEPSTLLLVGAGLASVAAYRTWRCGS